MHTFCVASEGSLSMSLMSGATRFLMSSKVMHMNPPLVGTDGGVSERDDKYFARIGNNAISVSLVSIHNQRALATQKELFSMSDCKMYWQSSGEYLAVKLNLYNVNELETMATAEHLMATEVDWDCLSIFSFQAGGSDHKANLNLDEAKQCIELHNGEASDEEEEEYEAEGMEVEERL
ncbi:unnamed protein product [Sphagnum jensenii]|uniref:Uncharacterized protein n=1 Tax=Sphagnum jensenii TaxID=128206 RepID=A0ABP0XCN2_9BRYO